MNQDVQIVCNGVKSQVMKDIDLGSNPVTMPVSFVPRAVRSPVNFKQPPKVVKPEHPPLETVLSANQLAPSIS